MANTLDDDERLDQFALAIGKTCMNWAFLETTAISTLERLLGVGKGYERPSLRCFDFRQILSAIKVEAFNQSPNNEWYNLIEEQINFIDNVLRTERNRYVHDYWEINEDLHETASRISFSPKIIKPQSRSRELLTGTSSDLTLSDAQALSREIDEEAWFMLYATIHLPDYSPEEVKMLRKGQPKRLLLLRLKERQRQRDIGVAKQQLPSQSSPA